MLAAAEAVSPQPVAAAVVAGCCHTSIKHLRREPFSLLLWARAALPVCLVEPRLRRGRTLPSLDIPRQLAAGMAEAMGFPAALVVMAAQAAVVAAVLSQVLVALERVDKAMLVVPEV